MNWISRIDWWAVAAVLFLAAALGMSGVDLLDKVETYRNLVSWLGYAAIVSALFSVRDSLGAMHVEQLRRAYDPSLRK